jgi:HK97 family phage portal protein
MAYTINQLAEMFSDKRFTIPITNAATAADYSPQVNKAIGIRANAIATLPAMFQRGGDELEQWPVPQSMERVLYDVSRDMDIYGHALLVKYGNRAVRRLARVHPENLTVTLEAETDAGMLYGFMVSDATGTRQRRMEPEEVVYFRDYTRYDDGEPVSRTKRALPAAQVLYGIEAYNADFFQKGALGGTVITTKEDGMGNGRMAPADFAAFIQNLRDELRRGVSRLIGINNPVEFHNLLPTLKDMDFTVVRDSAVRAVADAFGVPYYILSDDSANFATAYQSSRNFYDLAIIPAALLIQETLNEQLLAPAGYSMEFQPQKIDAYRTDEAERAGSLALLIQAGMPLQLGLEVLGYDLSDEQWARVEVLPEPEALPVLPEPEPERGAVVDMPVRSAYDMDLGRWRTKAVRRLKDGKPLSFDFDSEHIPAMVSEAVKAQLETVENRGQLEAVFAGALEWEGYP